MCVLRACAYHCVFCVPPLVLLLTIVHADPPSNVAMRVKKMVSCGCVSGLVNILSLESCSAMTSELCMLAMCRLAVEVSCRGMMIQQGALSACIEGAGVGANEAYARHAIAKMLVTTNPMVLLPHQRLGCCGPLVALCKEDKSTNLMQFESLLSLTNLAPCGIDCKRRIIGEGGLSAINFLMYSEHEMVKRAATECISNLLPAEKVLEYFAMEDKMKIWVAFMRDFEDDFECARAAAGGIARASYDPDVKKCLISIKEFPKGLMELVRTGNLELMHRVLVAVKNFVDVDSACPEGREADEPRADMDIEELGKRIRESFEESGILDFCKVFAQKGNLLIDDGKGGGLGEGARPFVAICKDILLLCSDSKNV